MTHKPVDEGTLLLREMVEKLLGVDSLPEEERQTLQFMTAICNGGERRPFEGMMYPENEAHIRARFEWYFKRDGTRRRAA